jgi:rubrerythrin
MEKKKERKTFEEIKKEQEQRHKRALALLKKLHPKVVVK